jgi:hypothetical protein
MKSIRVCILILLIEVLFISCKESNNIGDTCECNVYELTYHYSQYIEYDFVRSEIFIIDSDSECVDSTFTEVIDDDFVTRCSIK